MRALFFVAGLAALAACGEPAEPAGNTSADETKAEAVASEATSNPLGSGSALSGSVSGLTGQITAFRVQETATEIIVDLAADVLFAFDSAELSPDAPEQLRKTVEQIARGGAGEIAVIGHTDSMGTDAYNDDLSLRRARAVAGWLSAQGNVEASRLKAEGRGEREPAAPNEVGGADNPDNRALNRRVRVIIPKA